MKTTSYSHTKENRNECVLCKNKTTNLFTIKMPTFMGVNTKKINEFINDMSFNVCNFCGEVQINELLDLSMIYQNNHNINIVGDTWKNHYINFAEFVKNDISKKVILEISDPSAKIAKLSTDFKYWYIVEPNPESNDIKNVEYINGFFDENFNYVTDVDIIIHSHLLEHVHSPIDFLKKCNNLLKDDGLMFISIPDMQYILDQKYSPNNILHFEHTYFLNYEILKFLCAMTGFKIINTYFFKNHSIFYKLKKEKTNNESNSNKFLTLKIKNKFIENFIHHIDNIKNIDFELDKYTDYDIYIFGAHVSSQFYLYNGLNENKILSIIDNDKNKENYNLYGTNLSVKNPNVLENKNKCIVICSHIGIYYDEIVKQLLEINKNIIIL